MALGNGYVIIWLDAHIGSKNNNRLMKQDFQMTLVETSAVPPDPINDLICAVRQYSAPIEFVQTIEEALQLIQNSLALEKKIIFISSASLGRTIIPEIQKKDFQIESYYIFCGNMLAHSEWGIECINDGLEMQMFDHETTLLTRLGRDMSNILIKDGKTLLIQKQPELALKYFQFAYALADKAVEHDKPLDASDKHRPSTEYRHILDALIKDAKKLMS